MKIGILGGGQLGMMMLEANEALGLDLWILEKSKQCSAGPLTDNLVEGDFKNFEDVYGFGKQMDVVTVEIEHVNVEALEKLESEGIKVYPSPSVLKVVQDKGLQKQFYADHDIPTSAFELISSKDQIPTTNFPIVQKARKGGYDGQGVAILRSPQDIETKAFDVPSVLEHAVDIDREISVIVVRSATGEVETFPTVEMAFDPETNLVTELFAPSTLTPQQNKQAKAMAIKVSEKLNVVGLLAVELFLDKAGNILVNEIAPRPHNSGHQTIEGNETSQFEQHLRAISGMELGNTDIIKPSVMVNVLGEKGHTGPAVYQGKDALQDMDDVYLHLYGKAETRPARKMGHVTILGNSIKEAREKGRKVLEVLKVVS